MNFTYKSYENFINRLKVNGYSFVNYHNWNEHDRCVLLRHDIDEDIGKACFFADLEKSMGVQSTYFVLLTSNFYNVFSKEACDYLKKISDAGHEIGLHFDEARYPDVEGNTKKILELIRYEADILGKVIGKNITTVSMHRPSRGLLEADLKIPGMINSYSQTFFKDFKYLSDSRRRWREPIDRIIETRAYNRIHILTHAFWYNDEECDLHDSVSRYINDGNRCRYNWFLDNITDLESIMSPEEIRGLM